MHLRPGAAKVERGLKVDGGGPISGPKPAHLGALAKWRMSINVVFSNPYYQVLEYPELGAFELVDNLRASGTLIQGDLARAFRASLVEAFRNEPSEEEIEAVIGNYDALMSVPQYRH